MKVVVGTLELSLRLSGCRSLKDKRQVVASLLAKVRKHFLVSIGEVGDQDLWGNSSLGVACVSNNTAQAESVLQHVLDYVEAIPDLEVTSVAREILRV